LPKIDERGGVDIKEEINCSLDNSTKVSFKKNDAIEIIGTEYVIYLEPPSLNSDNIARNIGENIIGGVLEGLFTNNMKSGSASAK
jgi:hypothetical protein